MYRNLKFFNKSGHLTNFYYDHNSMKWLGQVDLGLISVDLISSYQLFVMEDVLDDNDSSIKLTYPIKNEYELDYIVKFKDSVEDIFIYNFTFDAENSIDVLEKSYESYLGLNSDTFVMEDNIKKVSSINLSAISINLALWPKTENSFFNTILIIDPNNNDHILAEINVYGESEGEDERLTTMLTNLGIDLLPSDFKIFKETDVNEEDVDWIILNRKKKELLLEHSNIFPYMGSYKALINILKYFGYSNVRLKEYWQNIDETTANFGKFKQVDIAQIFTNVADYIPKELINSKIWNKTNKFGLFYDITIEDDKVDSSGTPFTKEIFTFTPDEILIKIFALKKKLQQKFLPINAKIVDIVGEAVLFGTYSIGHMHSQNVINFINEELDINLICPKTNGYIDDLRYLERSNEIDITNYSQLELSKNEINLVKDNNWKKSTYFPNNFHVNIGFPLILNIDFNLKWDDVKESFNRIEGDTSSWNTLDLFSQWSLTNLTYEIESSNKVFKYVKNIELFNTNDLEIGIILPYKDTYSVKVICRTSQNFEHVIYKKDFISVDLYNADFIGFYSHLNNPLTWSSSKIETQLLTKENLGNTIQWDSLNSIWDVPQQENDPIEVFDISYDNLDLIEFRQNLKESDINDATSLKPLTWSKTKSLIWDESKHLWWDNIGTSMTTWSVFSLLDLNSSNTLTINNKDSINLNHLNSFNSLSDSYKIIATLNTVKQLNDLDNLFSDFIYYYSPYFDLDDLNNSILKYDIKAVSKKFSSYKTHLIENTALNKKTISRESIDFGFIGDTPAHFEIYKKSDLQTTVNLTINKLMFHNTYTFLTYIKDGYVENGYVENGYVENILDYDNNITQSSSITLTGTIQDFLTQLNNSTDSIISSFSYKLHQVKSELNGDLITFKIIAASKFKESNINYKIELSNYNDVIVTPFARPIIKNPSYQNVNIVKYSKKLPLYTRLFLTTDNCNVSGVKNIKWAIKNSSAIKFKDIYLNSNIISYLFSVKGSYDISIDVTDKNGNKTNVTKTELIKIT